MHVRMSCHFILLILCLSEECKYSFKWRDVYLFCTAVFYIFVLSFFICVCHCLLNDKRLVTSCCQSVHRRTFCICICRICLRLCRKKVTAGSLLFWNLPFSNYKTGILGSFKMCEMVEFIKKSSRNTK